MRKLVWTLKKINVMRKMGTEVLIKGIKETQLSAIFVPSLVGWMLLQRVHSYKRYFRIIGKYRL